MDPDGKLATGERHIEAAEADVVRRIFEEYGASPRCQWSSSTINGNRTRETGILNNELLYRPAGLEPLGLHQGPGAWSSPLMPAQLRHPCHSGGAQLRIVDQDPWDRAKTRQTVLENVAPTIQGGSRPSGRSSARATSSLA